MWRVEMLTAAEVADVLEVTTSRVHQLVDEGRLAPPERHGARTLLWPRALIDLHRSTRPHSGVLADIQPAAAPIPLVTNSLLAIPELPTPLHIRVWAGRERALVVIGDVTELGLRFTIDPIMSIAHGLELAPLAPVWVTHRVGDDNTHELVNVVLEEVCPTRSTRATARLLPGAPPSPTLRIAHRIEVTPAAVARALGSPLEAMVYSTYTPPTVERWLQHRPGSAEALQVEEPQAAWWLHQEYGAHACVLDSLARNLECPAELREIADYAAQILIGQIRAVHKRLPNPPRRPAAPPGIRWVTRLARPELTPAERHLIETYPAALPFELRRPVDLDASARQEQKMRNWAQLLREPALDDPEGAAALAAAARTISTLSRAD